MIIPQVIPVIASTMSPGGNDATLVLRVTTMLTQAWFDAVAPYHPTAVGVSSRLCRRPMDDANGRHRNIAVLRASIPVLTSLFPADAERWRQLASDVLPEQPCGSDADAMAVGDAAGHAVVLSRTGDGMNQLGDHAGRRYHRQPYADTTGYAPVNAADELVDPSRWQPLTVADRVGIYRSQRFVTPQMALTRPYSYADPAEFEVAPGSSRSALSGPGFEDYDPAPRDERPVEENLLERAALARAHGERQIVDAITSARAKGISWQRIGELLGTSAQAAQQRYGAVIEAS